MQEINAAYDKIKEERENSSSNSSSNNSSRQSSNSSSNSSSNNSSRQSSSSSSNPSSNNSSRQSTKSSSSSSSSTYENIRNKININSLDDAEDLLASIHSNDRNAEWYFLKGKISYAKGWLNEAQEQFTKAYNLNPDNKEYCEAYERFEAKATSGLKYNPIKDCCVKDFCNPCCLCSCNCKECVERCHSCCNRERCCECCCDCCCDCERCNDCAIGCCICCFSGCLCDTMVTIYGFERFCGTFKLCCCLGHC